LQHHDLETALHESEVIEMKEELKSEIESTVANDFLLSGIEQADPVYFCSIEPPSAGAGLQFDKALKVPPYP
jgi:hypothetical protein